MTALTEVRHRLLALHRALLDAERLDYERIHGRTNPGEFLALVIGDAAFAWLQPMTTLIVQLDELLEDENAPGDREAWLIRVRELLAPDAQGDTFQRHYAAALQRSVDVVLAHGAILQAMPSPAVAAEPPERSSP
jgi:hypothetical protein